MHWYFSPGEGHFGMAEVEKYYPKQQSLDLSLTLGAATDAATDGGLGASGPDGTSRVPQVQLQQGLSVELPVSRRTGLNK